MNIKIKLLFGTAIVSIGIALAMCSNPSSQGEISPLYSCDQALNRSGSVITQGSDTILFGWAQKIARASSCNITNSTTTYSSRFDTTAAKTDTFNYEVRSDSLLLSTAGTKTAEGTVYVVLKRDAGTGMSLNGVWRYDSLLVAATEPLSLQTQIGLIALHTFWSSSMRGYYWSVSGGSIQEFVSTFFTDSYLPSLAAEGVTDTTQYSLTVDSLSHCLITINSTLSGGEKVTIYGDGDQNVHYSSSNAAHAAYIYYKAPPSTESCPNATRPTWWAEFLTSNKK